jgi:integrase
VTYRRLRITTPDLGAFYSVVDEHYEPHELASAWLRTRIYAAGHSESTSAEYASSLASYLTWVGGADLAAAASKMHLFAAYLAVAPIESGARRGYPCSAGRINRILVAVRDFYRFAVAEDAVDADVLRHLYEVGPDSDRARVRHRRREPRRHDRSPDQATADEVMALLEHARTARDRLLIMPFALIGLRVGQALGLRRQDLHFVPATCAIERALDTGPSGMPVP